MDQEYAASRVAPRERRLAVVQLAVAATGALAAWGAHHLVEPRPAGTSAFEALFQRTLWKGLFLAGISYTLAAAAAGYAIGVVAVFAAIQARRIAVRNAPRWLTLAPLGIAAVATLLAWAAA